MSTTTCPIPVLTWHKVSPRPEPGITVVGPARFRAQVEALRAGGARSLSLEAYLARRGRQEAGEGLCLLCFDDAYACVADEAYPVLRMAGFTATLFPVLDWIGRDNRWDRGLLGRRYPHLDEGGITRLLEAGWSLGLHGRTHCHLAGRSLVVLDRELVSARAELEQRFARAVHAVAWPYGRCDRRAVLVAQAAGLRLGFGRGGGGHPMCRDRHHLYAVHGPAQVAAMLGGAPPGPLQHVAGWGARLSSWIGGRAPRLV